MHFNGGKQTKATSGSPNGSTPGGQQTARASGAGPYGILRAIKVTSFPSRRAPRTCTQGLWRGGGGYFSQIFCQLSGKEAEEKKNIPSKTHLV